MSRRKRRGLRRNRHGRFVKGSAVRAARRNPVRRHRRSIRRSHRRHARRNPVRSMFRRIVRRRNPLGFPDFQTIGGIALGAIVVRAVTPRVVSFIPGKVGTFLMSGWGAVVATAAVGAGLSMLAKKFMGEKWSSAVMSGTIAVAGVQAADLVIPKLPGSVSADTMAPLSAYDQATQLADGTSISTGDEGMAAYMGPGY